MNIYLSRIASTVSLIFAIACSSVFAQRPSDPALLVPQAHMIAVGAKGDIWVADTVNSTVHKFVRK